MFRGTTARTAIALFTAALLALQFFTPTETFASAHTLSHAQAKAESDTALPAKPMGTQHLRDRQRGSAYGWALERPPISRQQAAEPTPAASGASHHRITRSSRAHSSAALQVFRC